MTLDELIAQFRLDTDDLVAPYLSSDAAVTSWLNEAEQEACVRASLIHDVSTTAVCSIAVTAPTSTYLLHTSILDITRAAFTPTDSTTEYEVYLTTREEMDRVRPGWRKVTDMPTRAIHKDTSLQLACIPSSNGTISLEFHRFPLVNIETKTPKTPEIGSVHHRHLLQWALFKCYSRPDSEVFDPNRAARAEQEFSKVFGLRPGAKYRRDSQANRPSHNVAIW